LEAASLAARVLQQPEVARRWSTASAVPEWTVGGLGGHAYLACRIVIASLDAALPQGLPVESPAVMGLLRMRVDGDVDLASDEHRRVRHDGDYVGRLGHATVAGKFMELIAVLDARLAAEPPDRLVRAPSRDVAYSLDDWVANRTIEMLVHADDLAVSADLGHLALPADAAGIAIRTLVEASRRRAGDLAVLRALTRRERQPADVLRAL
jgi:hypothetical protein